MAAEQDFNKLLAVIKQLNSQLNIANSTITQMQKIFSATGSENFNKALANQRIQAERLNQELVAATNNYLKLKNAAVTTIPGGHPSGGSEVAAETRLRAAYRKSAGVPDIQDKQTARIEAEKQIVDSLRKRVQVETKYTQALEQARAHGFDVKNLVKAQSRGTAGIEQLQFQKYDEGGVQGRFDTFVNKAGRATPGISNQFRSFGQGVIRDIGELTKWSIALAAVYGPMRKLQELTQIMIENEVRLAEASISVNSSFIDQSKIFDTSAAAANAAGESVSGVIDAFTLAYRAAGGTANEVERFGIATTLLSDSLTLSKLSTLDQASAIDTLSASLRQTERGLGNGTELLDKWVRVTKVANVDLTTLATGFAVVGDAAEAAGIGVDQLNGLIAAISETGISSGKETANIARSIVSGFQSENARKELENLGISATTVTGELRPFLEVMQEIYNLRQQGTISDSQFSKLTLALGGGTRRQAAYSTFIENFDRVFSIAQESERASGDAEAALAKQLETVQTSIERLGNAFQELAQTMGTEGGFLGLIKGSVNGITALVTAFDGLISLLGKATPAMAAFIATTLILKSRGIPSIQAGLTGIGQGLQTDALAPRLDAASQGLSRGVPSFGQRAGNFASTNLLGTNLSSGIFQGIALAAIPALQNATNKDDRFGKTKATADIIGGLAGGIVGSLTGAGPVIGAAIGVSIAESFVTATIARKTDIFGYGKGTTIAEGGGVDTSKDKEAKLKDAEIDLYKSIGYGNEQLGRFVTSFSAKKLPTDVENLNDIIQSGDQEKLNKYLAGRSGPDSSTSMETVFKTYGITKDDILKAFSTGSRIEASAQRPAYLRASEQARGQYDVALAEYNAVQPNADISTEFTNRVGQNKQLFTPVIESIAETMRKEISQERLSGDLKGTQYTQQIKSLTGVDTKTLQYYTAFGKEFEKLNKDIKTSSDLFEAFSQITVYGSQESVNELTAITGEISTLINLLNDPALKNEKLLQFQGGDFSREDLQKMLTERTDLAATLATDTYQQAGISRLNIPDVQGDINKPLTSDEFGLIKKQAVQLQEQFYKGFLKIPDQLYDGLQASWDEWAQIIKDSGDAFYETVEGIDPQFFQQAMQKLLEEGKISSQKANPYGIEQIDLPGSRAGELQNMVNYFSGYLTQKFPKYEQNPEEIGVIFNDYVTGTLHGDNLAIKLALEKLVDLNQKQLDGMYNIPEGATFWVPLQAAYYRNQGGGGGGGLPDIGTQENTSATQQNTQALTNLNQGLMTKQKELLLDLGGTGPGAKKMTQKELWLDAGGTGPGYKDTRVGSNAYSEAARESFDRINPAKATGGASFLETLKSTLLMKLLQFGGGAGQGLGAASQTGSAGTGFRNITQSATTAAPINTRLEMKIDNSTQLIVDGRILASVLSPFLASELLRLEASQGTITKRYVI